MTAAGKGKPVTRPACLEPSMTLLCKLGSIVVHADELTSPDGHEFDKIAIRGLLDNDLDIQQWIKEMGKQSLLPRKRKP